MRSTLTQPTGKVHMYEECIKHNRFISALVAALVLFCLNVREKGSDQHYV